MSEQYIKGACVHCGGRIAFPPAAAGNTIACPHCQRPTPLTAPAVTPVAAPVAAPAGVLKCACSSCAGRIEFPANAIGVSITCPHCGNKTVLNAPGGAPAPSAVRAVTPVAPPPSVAAAKAVTPAAAPVAAKPKPAVAKPIPPPPTEEEASAAPEATPRKSKKMLFVILGVVVLLLAGGGWAFWYAKNKKSGGTAGAKQGGTGLQVLQHELQKAKEGGLVFVVGTVTNHSEAQFFNLKVEFEIFDQSNTSLGTAQDIVGNIGPHGTWSFKAMVIEEGAKEAKMTNFTFEK